ncbi:MAG: extracellular solute-binding protein [Meiothermus sp.]|nr:extracellular solute-binding protein [Meiothermus sp.]
MKRYLILGGLGLLLGAGAQNAPVTLNFYSSGDVNVRDLWEKSLIPMFERQNPNIKINLVFSASSAAGATVDRMAAAVKANRPSGVDLLEGPVLDAADAGLLEKLDVRKVPRLFLVETNALERLKYFGLPYRGSSVVLAYDSNKVKNPPRTLEALIAWIEANPGQFTYNAPDAGGSGRAFVTRVLRIGINPQDSTLFETGYDPAKQNQWDRGLEILKRIGPKLYQGGQYSRNNAETLQFLARGAITMGPVWSDQALSNLKQGLLPQHIKLIQLTPPFYGGSAYVGVSKDSSNKAAGYTFLNWLMGSEAQSVVTEQMNGYPGIKLINMPADVRQKFGSIAKSYSFEFSSKFGSDMVRLWYEKVAGTPQPQR